MATTIKKARIHRCNDKVAVVINHELFYIPSDLAKALGEKLIECSQDIALTPEFEDASFRVGRLKSFETDD